MKGAREDYPSLYNMSMYEADSLGPYNRALDEIDALRRWKSEALIVLAQWDTAFEAVPEWFVRLGDSKSEKTAEYIRWLEGAVAP